MITGLLSRLKSQQAAILQIKQLLKDDQNSTYYAQLKQIEQLLKKF